MKKLIIITGLILISINSFNQVIDSIIDTPEQIILYGRNDTVFVDKEYCAIEYDNSRIYLNVLLGWRSKRYILNSDSISVFSNDSDLINYINAVKKKDFKGYTLLYSTNGDTTWYKVPVNNDTSFLKINYYTSTILDSIKYIQNE